MYVKELELFVTVKLLEDTLAELSLGKLCEEHGDSYEWSITTSRQKWQKDSMQYGKPRADHCPRIANRLFQFDHMYVYNIVTAGLRSVNISSSNHTKSEYK